MSTKKRKLVFFANYNAGILSQLFLAFASSLTSEYEVILYGEKKNPVDTEIDGVRVLMVKNKGKFLGYFNRLIFLMKIKPDKVIANFTYVNPALLGSAFLKYECIPWIHTLESQIGSNWYKIAFKKFFFRFASTFIVNSILLQEDLKNTYGVNQMIHPLPFWSDIEDRGKEIPHNNELIIGVPGRLHSSKNTAVIFKALEGFQVDVKKIKVKIAGSGSELDDLKNEARQLIQNKPIEVEFLGNLSKGEMINFYDQCNLIVLPSFNEAFGLTMIEAMARGRAVIVSEKFGALKYLEPSDKIKTFDPTRPDELAQQLAELNLDDLESYGLNLYSIYKRVFDKKEVLKRFKAIVS